ncbi:MAG: XdhC family protein [Herpetosiphonaceae bacterium]|nr:XdhC family protein [Herpetosiphonaceae bacterium]
MREIIEAIDVWRQRGEQIALATVVQVAGAAPRGPGAMLVVAQSGAMVGSVSGGCVEAAVVAACLRALKTGQISRSTFGFSDEQAWEVGLACGGSIDILIEPLTAPTSTLLRETVGPLLDQEREWSLAVVLDGPQAGTRWLISPAESAPPPLPTFLADQVLADSRTLLEHGHSEVRSYPLDKGDTTVFIHTQLPAPHLVIVGGVHIATALCVCAKQLGWRVTIVDPRSAFATSERFPLADARIHAWPDEALPTLRLDRRTFVAVLTHDPKLDDPALLVALKHPVGYIGVLGSRATQARRRDRLRDQGVSDEDLARLHGPIGLPLGGKAPAEIAISILAEMIKVQHTLGAQ